MQSFSCNHYDDDKAEAGFCREMACMGFCSDTPLPHYCMEINYVETNLCKDNSPPPPAHCQPFTGKTRQYDFWCKTVGCRSSYHACLKSDTPNCPSALYDWVPTNVSEHCTVKYAGNSGTYGFLQLEPPRRKSATPPPWIVGAPKPKLFDHSYKKPTA